jgi:hypothetical protein
MTFSASTVLHGGFTGQSGAFAHRRRAVTLIGVVSVSAVVGDAGFPVAELGLPLVALLLGEFARVRRELAAVQVVRVDQDRTARLERALRRSSSVRLRTHVPSRWDGTSDDR